MTSNAPTPLTSNAQQQILSLQSFLNDGRSPSSADQVRILGTADEPWFVATDVAKVLGIINSRNITSKLDADEIDIYSVKTRRGSQKVRTISSRGVGKIISRCRKASQADIELLCKLTGISCQVYKCMRIENDTLQSIIEILPSSTEYYREFPVGGYRIDLFLPFYRLAIECDEYDHKKYQKDLENVREKYIIIHTQCLFIRFNPHEKDFKITKIIQKVVEHMFKSHRS